MARIPEEVIERLKEEVSLQRLVELAGVELRQQGKDLVGLCPFHEERTGSLVVSLPLAVQNPAWLWLERVNPRVSARIHRYPR
jgi:CHC2 zinc finger